MAASTTSATLFSRTVMLGTPTACSPPTVVTNEDGQVLITTRGELNIYTPAFGIQVDKPAEAASGPSIAPAEAASRAAKGKGKEKDVQGDQRGSQVPLFRTSIKVEKKDVIEWAGWVSELQSATAGTRPGESHWRCGTWSPTGLSSLGGCVIAAVTTNHEALLFEPEKNAYKGTWKETFDLTSHLVKLVISEDDLNPQNGEVQLPVDRRRLAARLHECQATSARWSSAVEGTYGDYSILAVGHRSGHISLWRRYPDGTMGILHRYRMSGDADAIALLSWSPWTLTTVKGRTLALACLAVADSQGRVWSTEVTQVVTSPHVGFAATAGSVIPDEDPADVWAIQPLLICESDRRPATQFRWISRGTIPELVYAKIGEVNFVTLEPVDISASGDYRVQSTESLDLPTVGEWMGASTFSPCSGIEYLPRTDAILVALTDGSLHSITLDPSPAFTTGIPHLHPSAELTAAMRGAYEQIGTNVDTRLDNSNVTRVKGPKRKHGPRVNGFASLGGDGEVGWQFEVVRPDALNYKANTSVKTVFLSASLFGDADGGEQFRRLTGLFGSNLNSRISSPLTTLRSLLHFVHDHIADAAFTETLRAFLEPVPLPALPEATRQYANKVAATAAFVDKLFGETTIEQLRCREAIARFMQRLSNLPRAQQHDTVALHTALARQIAREVLSRLGAVLSNAKSLLGAQELTISGRILLASASLLPSSSAGTPAGAEPILPPDALSTAFEGVETCPACRASVPFANIRQAACLNGHQWERCSITLAVVSSVRVRTCTGCERKALIKLELEPPTPETQGTTASVDVVNSLLRAATCCLYCGGRWMRIR